MGYKSKQEYPLAIRDRSLRVGQRLRITILDEFCSVGGYARKYAIELLSRKPRPGRK